MTKTKGNASDYLPGRKFEFIPGFEVEAKCRVIGIQYLEDAYDLPVDKIDFETGRIREAVNLMVAIGLSSYPDKSVEDIKAIVNKMDVDDMQKIAEEMGNVFMSGSDSKNRARPSKVKGNLAEQKTA